MLQPLQHLLPQHDRDIGEPSLGVGSDLVLFDIGDLEVLGPPYVLKARGEGFDPGNSSRGERGPSLVLRLRMSIPGSMMILLGWRILGAPRAPGGLSAPVKAVVRRCFLRGGTGWVTSSWGPIVGIVLLVAPDLLFMPPRSRALDHASCVLALLDGGAGIGDWRLRSCVCR